MKIKDIIKIDDYSGECVNCGYWLKKDYKTFEMGNDTHYIVCNNCGGHEFVFYGGKEKV